MSMDTQHDVERCELLHCPRCLDHVHGDIGSHVTNQCLQGHDATPHFCCPTGSGCELGEPVNITRGIPGDLPLEEWLAEIEKDEPMRSDEKKARALVRQRSGGDCEGCGQGKATNWHHRKNRTQGGVWSASNGMDLCGSGTTGCHGWVTSNPVAAEALGWTVLNWQNPRTEVVKLHGRRPVYLDNEGNYIPVGESE